MTESYLRYPHIGGDDIVFVADDDLWLVAASGGRASRLTSERAPITHPRFSPDASRIAYTRMVGNVPEVFVLDLGTGEVRQLTYWGAALTFVDGWLDDETVLVASGARQPYRIRMWLYGVDLDGVVTAQPYGTAMSAAIRADGHVAVTTPYWRDLARWKRYRGGTAPQLWLSDGGDEWTRALPEVTAGIYAPAWVGDRLAFSSDLGASFPDKSDEQAQLWSVDASGGDLIQHTHHTPSEGYVRNPTSDGARVVYHARGRLYVMASLDDAPQRLDVELAAPVRPLAISPTQRLESFAPDHGGDLSAVEWYGAVYALTHRAGPARALSAAPGVRARMPQIVGRTGLVAYISDQPGEDAVELRNLDGTGEPRRIARGRLGRVLSLAASPDGTLLAVVTGDGRICTVRLSDGRVVELATSPHGEATGLAFSPDGRYLAWSAPTGTGMTTRLYGADLRARRSRVEALTSGRFRDTDPVFTLDGQHLVFLSARTFDPRYDEQGFDLSFTSAIRPYLVPLSATAPAPFGAAADGWPISKVQSEATAGEEKEAESKVSSAELDVEGFEERLVAFPVPAADYHDLRAAKDGVLWRRVVAPAGELGTGRAGVEKEPEPDVLERYAFDTRSLTVLGPCDGFSVSGDGERVVLRVKDDVVVVPSTAKVEDDDPARVHVDLARLRRTVDPRPMWRQMFEENGRLMRDFYWREDMDGNDWNAILERHRPSVERVRTLDDLVDVLWETVGELDTSHAYVNPPPAKGVKAQGQLGADLEPDTDGARIVRILPGESSDPAARSPLRAAGIDAQVGDVIVAIDGQPVDRRGVGPLLVGAADTVVEITLRRGETRRRVAVVPTGNETPLRYQAWVASRIAYVERASGGRLGYVHVPDMMALGWAQFHRGLDLAMAHEGVVADMRYNGGGHTSQLIIERLSRKIIGWDLVRHGSPESYPSTARRGPVVFLTNQFAGSDGDIVCAAAQELELGPVVGQRSWGGVIGIDGRFELVDGTSVTQPRYSFHFDTLGWDVENHGVDPDIEYVMSPSDWADEDARDPQLDRAITEALALLEAQPAAVPPELPAPRTRR